MLYVYVSVAPVIPYLEYLINYDYIKNELCENKDVPESNCNGMCHVKKQIKKIDNSDDKQDSPIPKVKITRVDGIFSECNPSIVLTPEFEETTQLTRYKFSVQSSEIKITSPPPQV